MFADEVAVASVFGVYGDGDVAKQGFRAGGGDGDGFGGVVGKRVTDVPHVALFFDVFHFQVGDGGAEDGVPVDEAFAAVDESLFVEAHEDFGDGGGAGGVHGEVFACPVRRAADAAHLFGDGAAGLVFPLPHFFEEFFTSEVVARDVLRGQLPLDDDLCGDAGVVGAGDPAGVRAFHAVVADEAVHDGLVEGVSHVQGAGDVGRRELDGEGGAAGVHVRLE